MRTTAAARNSPAGKAGATAANKRSRVAATNRAATKSDVAPKASAPTTPPAPQTVAVTAVRVLQVDEGLYALRIGEIAGKAGEIAGMTVPAALVSAPFAEPGSGVEIVTSFPGRGPWLGKDGGTIIVRSPTGGGRLIVTVYGDGEQTERQTREGQQQGGQLTSQLSLDLQRLDSPTNGVHETAPAAAQPAVAQPAVAQPAVAQPAGGQTPAPVEQRDTPTEILLHIERAGDRLFPGRGWVGALGRRMRIEAFSIRPLERLLPTDIEMKGFLPSGGETPWVPGGTLCGTRGRGLPLTGFAVRVVPEQADRFDVVYQGSFFAGGISPTQQNGDPCRSATAEDPLEAINLRLIERGADPGGGATAA